MDLITLLTQSLAAPIAKFLLKSYLSEPAEDVGGELIDVAKTKLKDYRDQREAARRFENIADRIVSRLAPLFEGAAETRDLNVEAVVREIGATLEGRVTSEFFLGRDLNPARLTAALREARPLPERMFSEAETQLYDRALSQAVRYVVEVAAALPGFDAAFAARSLERLGRVEDLVQKTLDTVERIERAVVREGGEDKAQRYEADYREAVIRNLDYVELFGADIEPESRRHALSVAYVSLALQTRGRDGSGEGESAQAETLLDTLSPEAGRLLIRGEAGSGKSTLFRWIAIEAARLGGLSRSSSAIALRLLGAGTLSPLLVAGQLLPPLSLALEGLKSLGESNVREAIRARLAHWAGSERDKDIFELVRSGLPNWRHRIPFLIRLRDCTGGRLPAPDAFPSLVAGELGSPPESWVVSVLREGGGLVLLDGVDEVPGQHRAELERAIEAIVRAYPGNYFLVSTRPAAVKENWLGRLEFREARVNPMSELDRSRFIDRWHEAVGRELERLGRPSDALPAIAARLKETLAESPSIARLATNPLLCAMICALHRDRGQRLPESQSELCEALCHVLLHRREEESGLRLAEFPEPYRRLVYKRKGLVVRELAHYMVRNGESSVPQERAVETVATMLGQFPGHDPADAMVVLRALVERSGMLRDARPGYIDFIHNTLKEYLAAERFVEAGDVGILTERALDPTWQPVVLFAVGGASARFATQVVERLIGNGGADGGSRTEMQRATRGRRLFALSCRAVALQLDPGLTQRLDAVERQLLPPRTMVDAEALAAGGDGVVPFLRYRPDMSAREAAASVRALRLIGTSRARSLLRAYTEDGRMGVVSELAQAMNPLELRVVREMVTGAGLLPSGFASQISDLTPLARETGLKELNLTGTRVSDLTPLSSLPSLQVLLLDSPEISDLAPLRALSRLEFLHLWVPAVTDLSPLAALTALRFLNVRAPRVTDLEPLSGLIGLTQLALDDTRAVDLSPLAGLAALGDLTVSGELVEEIGPLRELKQLRGLLLHGPRVRELSPLADLTMLSHLSVIGCPITDAGPLGGLASLKRLSLVQTALADVRSIARLTALDSLSLSSTPVRDVTGLSALRDLTELDLSWTQVQDVTPLSELVSLRRLDLVGTPVSDVQALLALPKLEWLDLRETRVPEDARYLKDLEAARGVRIPVGPLSAPSPAPRTVGAPRRGRRTSRA
jgi:Leucine-rich repeat (LRR) protein